ncbi:MAG TPA: hypothetical protein VG095_06525 [Chthoniobacterales bacterium]|nr:hypothetical protein [Chthoniobacterales bacterium]
MFTPKLRLFTRCLAATCTVVFAEIGRSAEGPTSFPITIVDSGGAYAAYYSDIISNLEAAGAAWARYVIGSGTLETEVVITSAVAFAPGGSVTSGFLRNDGTRNIYEQGATYELRTGIDPNGSEPDIRIFINPDYLTQNLWFDPQPGQRTDAIPPNRTDAISVFTHELGHAFLFNGWMHGTTGELPPDYMSTFDARVVFEGENFYFIGSHAQAHYGSAVPVTFGNAFHLGNAAPRPGEDLLPDLMNGVVFSYQTRYRISPLDVEIARDCEMAVTQFMEITAITRLTNGGIVIAGLGVPTGTHTIQASDDLTQNFAPVASERADRDGSFQFTETDATPPPRRFYQMEYSL